jgi:hypothetical protein
MRVGQWHLSRRRNSNLLKHDQALLPLALLVRTPATTEAPEKERPEDWGMSGSGGGTRTPDTRIMIPLL